ncbi:hypothetical protein HK104_006197 [Borealophlyctis nickersoniae]|nr:hypothetical protein HK104_006197 [Borealophlyctis nickersoniae]
MPPTPAYPVKTPAYPVKVSTTTSRRPFTTPPINIGDNPSGTETETATETASGTITSCTRTPLPTPPTRRCTWEVNPIGFTTDVGNGYASASWNISITSTDVLTQGFKALLTFCHRREYINKLSDNVVAVDGSIGSDADTGYEIVPVNWNTFPRVAGETHEFYVESWFPRNLARREDLEDVRPDVSVWCSSELDEDDGVFGV